MSSNISDEQLNAMLQTASKKLGISANQLRAALSDPKLAESVLGQMDKKSGGTFNLSDTQALEKLIRSNPKAKKMFDDITRGNGNG
jgi:hypothetical protein